MEICEQIEDSKEKEEQTFCPCHDIGKYPCRGFDMAVIGKAFPCGCYMVMVLYGISRIIHRPYSLHAFSIQP